MMHIYHDTMLVGVLLQKHKSSYLRHFLNDIPKNVKSACEISLKSIAMFTHV